MSIFMQIQTCVILSKSKPTGGFLSSLNTDAELTPCFLAKLNNLEDLL